MEGASGKFKLACKGAMNQRSIHAILYSLRFPSPFGVYFVGVGNCQLSN